MVICQERRLKELEIKAHLLFGKIYISQQENVSAITHLLKAKEGSKLIHHNYFLAQSILQIGIVYNHVFHYPKALENYSIVEKKYYDLLTTSNQILLLNYLG